MLNELVRYAERQGLAGPGFAPKMIKWAITCSAKGKLLGVNELSGGDNKKKNPGRPFAVCPEASGMNSGGKSHFLVETLETVLLMCKKEEDRPKFEAKHDFFVKQLRDAAAACPDCPEMDLFAEIVENEDHRLALIVQLQEAKAKPTDKITIMIEGRSPAFLVKDTAWHNWWAEYRKTLGKTKDNVKKKSSATKKSAGRMLCFATGEMVEPAMKHPSITELADVGAVSSGAPFISFNKQSLCSYGLKDSANAAMSEESAAAYRAGLNHVLANHSRRLAGAKVAYWFDKEEVLDECDLPELLLGGSNQAGIDEAQELDALRRAKDLLASIQKGDIPDFVKDNHYYALTLSGNAGRVVVRDWMTGPFKEMLGNIIAWFDAFGIVHRRGESLAAPPKFMAVLGGLVRDLKDVPAPLSASMWTAAIRRGSIPRTAVARAVERARIDVIDDNPPNHARMGLIKAYHIRKGDKNMNAYLNEDHPSKAYQCGRLMAVLADVQYAALGDVGAGVVQRYYAAASATPALVLGRLTRLSQFHFNKLGKEKKGLAITIERQIADIWAKIKDDLPGTLSLDEQSLFAMGFYQQKAHKSKGKKAEGEVENAEE